MRNLMTVCAARRLREGQDRRAQEAPAINLRRTAWSLRWHSTSRSCRATGCDGENVAMRAAETRAAASRTQVALLPWGGHGGAVPSAPVGPARRVAASRSRSRSEVCGGTPLLRERQPGRPRRPSGNYRRHVPRRADDTARGRRISLAARVAALKAPRGALGWDTPTQSPRPLGRLRHRAPFGMPVTGARGRSQGDLSRFDVVVCLGYGTRKR